MLTFQTIHELNPPNTWFRPEKKHPLVLNELRSDFGSSGLRLIGTPGSPEDVNRI